MQAKLYNPSGVGSAYISTYGTTFTASERHAGSRARLRHQQHEKDHSTTRFARGLHPMYTALHGLGGYSLEEKKEVDDFLKDSLHDLFDAVRIFKFYHVFLSLLP
jgi:hypothetical protein